MEHNNINIFLESLLNKELELLRKRFRPYKRRPFLNNKVTIDIKESSPNVSGLYENTKKEEKQHKYIHNIYITTSALDNYKNYCLWGMKRYGIRIIRNIIRHELIHAFVFDEFEEWEYINNCHGDYSPIFLGCLYWANGESGHPHTREFNNTDLCNQIKDSKTFDNVYLYLVRYIHSLEKTVTEINKLLSPTRELSIAFNFYGAGIIKNTYLKQNVIAIENHKKVEQSVECLKLGIGFLVDSNKLLECYKDKFTNGSLAKYHEERKAYMINEEILKQVIVVSNVS